MISTFVKNSISLLDDNPFLALFLFTSLYIKYKRDEEGVLLLSTVTVGKYYGELGSLNLIS